MSSLAATMLELRLKMSKPMSVSTLYYAVLIVVNFSLLVAIFYALRGGGGSGRAMARADESG